MPEAIFNGPVGRIEARYKLFTSKAPLALFLHPHPQFGGTMNNPIIHNLYYTFYKQGFSVLRFNFRGAGKSEGVFDHGIGELSDAAFALDWGQNEIFPESDSCWVVGFSFGAWIGMQLLMRRPEIKRFISIAPPANLYDFSFLAPCPSSGLIINGANDKVAKQESVHELVSKLQNQKGILIEHVIIPDANHFFDYHDDKLMGIIEQYIKNNNSSELKD